jgi:hypothetical protein
MHLYQSISTCPNQYRHRYANAVALLEQYVPVTGFINGVFGMVAGGACMVGPTLVAELVKRTTLG